MLQHIFHQGLEGETNHFFQQQIRCNDDLNLKLPIHAMFHDGKVGQHMLQLIGNCNFLQIGLNGITEHMSH
ncbi:hypothetical protein D3C74_493830 [compost metagenome]